MILLDITFTDIFKVWFGWNVIPYLIVLGVIIVLFSIWIFWILLLKIKGVYLKNYYHAYKECNKQSKKK